MAIAGLSVDQAGASAARQVQGAVREAGAHLPGASPFGQALEQIAAKRVQSVVQGRVDKEVRNLDRKLGGTVNRQALERALQGDVAGAINDVVTHETGPILGSVGDTGEPVGVVAGAVGGGAAWDSSFDLSQWGGLSQHLIATLALCGEDGRPLVRDQEDVASLIRAPITDASLEVSLNWQSPFENAGPETKMPSLMAMVQTGQLGSTLAALGERFGFSQSGSVLGDAKATADQLKGKTGITKLNSMQAFTGMPPIKIALTLHLRAVQDARQEVLTPYQALMQWALPRKIAEGSYLANLINPDSGSMLGALFPSDAPRFVSLTYGGERYAPLVIESIQRPLDGPRDARGVPIYLAVPITLATLTAMDRDDFIKIYQRG